MTRFDHQFGLRPEAEEFAREQPKSWLIAVALALLFAVNAASVMLGLLAA